MLPAHLFSTKQASWLFSSPLNLRRWSTQAKDMLAFDLMQPCLCTSQCAETLGFKRAFPSLALMI